MPSNIGLVLGPRSVITQFQMFLTSAAFFTCEFSLSSKASRTSRRVAYERRDPSQNGLTSFQTAALLFSEYICLAIMSFPYSYSVLGLVPGLILTVVQAAFVLYTSIVVW